MIVADQRTPQELRDREANLSHRLNLALSQRDEAYAALREILHAEPDETPSGTAWPSFEGRLQTIAGDVLRGGS